MKVKFTIWIWYCLIIGCLAIPLMVLDFWRPNWWNNTDSNIFFGVLIVFGGLSGALMAILSRMGKVTFIYSEKDKRGIFYTMSKSVAEREKDSSYGNLYSKNYYENYSEKGDDNKK